MTFHDYLALTTAGVVFARQRQEKTVAVLVMKLSE